MREMNDAQETLDQRADFEADFSEIELGRLTQAEYEFANLRHELFLEREHAEREILDREFEEELGQLLKTISAGDAETATSDPPGWPGL
jgi:hypothetical protein